MEGMCECCGGTLGSLLGTPNAIENQSLVLAGFLPFSFSSGKGLCFLRDSELQGGLENVHTGQPTCTPQNMKGFHGFHSTWMSSLPRDSGSTLELAEPRAVDFQGFCQLI